MNQDPWKKKNTYKLLQFDLKNLVHTLKHFSFVTLISTNRSKLLIQLENILHKYDSSVCEKLRENLELEDMFKVAKKELDEFMVLYRKEEAVYKNIVVKYEKEEQRKQQQRILLYMMNRAARKIQRYWQKWRKDQAKRARKARKSKKK